MHLLNALPQRLDPGATPTFAGLISSSLTSPASTNLTLGTGTGGTALTLADTTLAATFAGTVTATGNAFANGSYTIVGGTAGAFANAALTINNRSGANDLSVIALGYRPSGSVLNGAAYMGFVGTNASGNGAGDLIFGTRSVTTDTAPTERLRIASTGTVSISSTTAGSSGAGALVVQGGISAGNTGSAASYFGGLVTVGGGGTGSTQAAMAINGGSASGGGAFVSLNRNSVIKGYFSTESALIGNTSDDIALYAVSGGSVKFYTNGTTAEVLKLTSTGAANFGGAVTIGADGSGGGGANKITLNYEGNASSRSWRLINDAAAFGDFAIQQSTTRTGSTYANALIFDASLAATFAGAVTVGGTGTGGRLLVGTASSLGGYLFQINGDFSGTYGQTITATTSSGFMMNFSTSTGQAGYISSTGLITAYNTASDYRLKNSIAPMTGALAQVALLKPVTYKWNSDGSDGQGFIAHELAEIAPYAVTGEKDGERMQGVDYGKITPLLAAALQEAATKIKCSEARLTALEAK